MYEEGFGVERDEEKAVSWYMKASELGYPWAQCNLGFCLQNGIGIEKNETLGAYWYQVKLRVREREGGGDLAVCEVYLLMRKHHLKLDGCNSRSFKSSAQFGSCLPIRNRSGKE